MTWTLEAWALTGKTKRQNEAKKLCRRENLKSRKYVLVKGERESEERERERNVIG